MPFLHLNYLDLHYLHSGDKCLRPRLYQDSFQSFPHDLLRDTTINVRRLRSISVSYKTRFLLVKLSGPANCLYCTPYDSSRSLVLPPSLADLCKVKLLRLYTRADCFLCAVVGLPPVDHMFRLYNSGPVMYPTPYQNLISLPDLHNVFYTLDSIDIRNIRRDLIDDTYGSLDSLVAVREKYSIQD